MPHPKPAVLAARKAQLTQLWYSDATDEQIAQQLRIKDAATVRQVAGYYGLPSRSTKIRDLETFHKEFTRVYMEEVTLVKMAQMFGLAHASVVSKIARDLNLPLRRLKGKGCVSGRRLAPNDPDNKEGALYNPKVALTINRSLINLPLIPRSKTCVFIEGDPHRQLYGEAIYCGLPTKPESSYCPAHHARCYIRLPPRWRRSNGALDASDVRVTVGGAWASGRDQRKTGE